MIKEIRISVLFLTLGLFGSGSLSAADTDQPIEISADSAIREEPSGKTTYRGDVVLTQGSLEIRADSLVFSFDSDKTTLITAIGNPATLTQQPENADTPVDASASMIEYHEKNERVRLIGNAKILQDDAVIEGNTIEYLVGSQRVMAAGSPETGAPQRVKVTIPPNSLRDGK
ncbi:MAG: lipopolysaccharide transport periplasmic protein LptA [Pseudomonadota bacterium]|nr:lipopolysaccharide transport periplasmic protein LptA [Pseudomonadota bacterium]